MASASETDEQACGRSFLDFHRLRSSEPQPSGSKGEEPSVEQETQEGSSSDLAEKTLPVEGSVRETVEKVLLRMDSMEDRLNRMEERLLELTSILNDIRSLAAFFSPGAAGSTPPQYVTQVKGEEEKGTGKEGEEEEEGIDKIQRVEEVIIVVDEEKEEDGAKEEREKVGAEREGKEEEENNREKGTSEKGQRKKWSLWQAMKKRWQKKSTCRTEEGEEGMKDKEKREREDPGEGTSVCLKQREQEGKGGNEGAIENGLKDKKKKGIWSSLKRKFKGRRREKGTGEEGKNNSQDRMVAALSQKSTADIVDINIVVGRHTKVVQYLEKSAA